MLNPRGAAPPRLIPARAGNTSPQTRSNIRRPAHPRSRGEHTLYMVSSTSLAGSSPLARGTPRVAHLCSKCVRLIPARAGNTYDIEFTIRASAAHPRSRGEHGLFFGVLRLLPGSSPLARGTLEEINATSRSARLIPARAGNTRRLTVKRFSRPAHPRSRGEHYYWSARPELQGGSSPLARGTHQTIRCAGR